MAADTPELVELQSGACHHQTVVARPVGDAGVCAVSGDRYVDQPGVDLSEEVVSEAQPVHDAGCEAFDEDVGGRGQPQEHLVVVAILQIEHGAAFAAVPHLVPGVCGERITLWPFDSGDLRTVIGQQHGGDRTSDTP